MKNLICQKGDIKVFFDATVKTGDIPKIRVVEKMFKNKETEEEKLCKVEESYTIPRLGITIIQVGETEYIMRGNFKIEMQNFCEKTYKTEKDRISEVLEFYHNSLSFQYKPCQ